jgi:hypothetical protein
MHPSVERGDGAATGRPAARALGEFGEQGVEGFHGTRLFHAPASKVTAVSR